MARPSRIMRYVGKSHR
uniref:Uncharacterized protein n=1 Tax=Rhizophora mucronata TaxID=61149 RepID=A0A2P2NF03_RHIMU